MGFKVLEIQATPNPNAQKFVLDRPIVEKPMSFFNAPAAEGHPVASKLFSIPGVSSVLMLGDFVTVNKQAEVKWGAIVKKVQGVLEEV
jgi:NFU1 iron-sulfur cluster scaffold homolog, mitochondrial